MPQFFINGSDHQQRVSNVLSVGQTAKYSGNLAAYASDPGNFYAVPFDPEFDRHAFICADSIVGVSDDEPVISAVIAGAVLPPSNVAFINPNSAWCVLDLLRSFTNNQFYIISPIAQFVSVVIYGATNAALLQPPVLVTNLTNEPLVTNLTNQKLTPGG